MDTLPDKQQLTLLRQRFMLEDADTLVEWLWEEHPQSAAFVLNWTGSLRLAHSYLEPLPPSQQADVILRICYEDVQHALTNEQLALLAEVLREVAPTPRIVDSNALKALEKPVLRGLKLAVSYLAELDEDARTELLLELEAQDNILARICQDLAQTLADDDLRPHNLHIGLNLFCDYLCYIFNRAFDARAVAYTHAVEFQSSQALLENIERYFWSFCVLDESRDLKGFIQLQPRMLYHYLEVICGAVKAFHQTGFEKPDLTPLERQAALSLVQELATALWDSMHLQKSALSVAFLSPEAFAAELRDQETETVLSVSFTLQFGSVNTGQLQLVLPAQRWGSVIDKRSQPAPSASTDAYSTVEQMMSVGVDEVGALDAPAPIEDGDLTSDLSEASLQDMVFLSALEDAENATQKAGGEGLKNPLDLLLRGHGPQDISAMSRSSAEDEDANSEANLHCHYAELLLRNGGLSEADQALQKALKLQPEFPHAQMLSALVQGEQGMYLREIVTYKRLIEAKSCLPEVLILMARRFSFLGKVQDASQALERTMKMGFPVREIVETDDAFRAVRRSPHWRRLLQH